MDARADLGAYLRRDAEAVSRTLELLDAIEGHLATARAIVEHLPLDDQPWERLT